MSQIIHNQQTKLVQLSIHASQFSRLFIAGGLALALCLSSGQSIAANATNAGKGAQAAAGQARPAAPQHPHGFSVVFGPEVKDEAGLSERLNKLLAHFVPDASVAQKTAIDGIAKAAFTELKPLQEQQKTVHQARSGLLLGATVDRTALEQGRVEALRLADLISKRRDQADADATSALTAEQRAKIAALLVKPEKPSTPAASPAAILRNPFGG